MRRAPFRFSSCAACPMGRASRGGAPCPFVARRHGAQRTLYVEGDAAESLWFIRSGAVALSRASGERDAVHALRRAGDLVGLEALSGERYLDTARIAAPAILCGAARDTVAGWLGPETTALALLRHVVEQQTAGAPRPAGSARSRVARWLLDDPDPSEVSRQTAARILGLAPETLSRVLAELAAAGVIALTRRAVTVRRRDALARLAGDG